ncbi:hypothetical protein ACFLX2_00345 [Candidatus Dependentiae bacterium]
MKITRYIIISFALLTFFIHSSKVHNYQYSNNFAQEIGGSTVDPYLPIAFSSEGISTFLTKVYNHPDYGPEFLPNNFSHLLQFLQHGVNTRQEASFAQSVFKLFTNKLKSASYVNAYVFADMLKPLQKLLQHYFVGPQARTVEQLKVSVNDVLYSSFLSQFDFFKRDPKKFFNSLSNEILTSLNHELHSSEREIRKEQLRQTVIRFFELCASKLVWSPDEPQEIWKSIRMTSQQFADLMEDHIIEDIDHLDDLLWSITHRFCFFLDLTGADLPIPFYHTVKQDLLRKMPLLCKLEEQEPLIRSKSDYMMQALLEGEAKARAQESGIIVR